jgi:hypothetical protein
VPALTLFAMQMSLLAANAELREQVRDGATVDMGEGDSWNAWPWKPAVNSPAKTPKKGSASASLAGKVPAERSGQ